MPGVVSSPLTVGVVAYDAGWPAAYMLVASLVRRVLGNAVLELHHVGSTSVPGLPAKPVIDLDLVVVDPTDEGAYVAALESVAFVHWLREPWWHDHRLLKLTDPLVHLHVFGPDCPEVVRHLMFRDWLREHPADRETYAAAKREAAAATHATGGTGMDYNRHKEAVVREVYDRMFRAHGLLPRQPRA